MKKFLALLLAMMMLFAISAQAEDAYLRQINQTRYVNTFYLPAETFPRVALAATYPELLYNAYTPKDPLFAVFGLPENAIATSFALNTCHLIDEDAGIQYSYQMMDNYSYETLLNKCTNDAYIIFDGSDKKAAYLDPDRARAYGLVGVPEIGKGAKLYITVYLDGLGRNITTEQRVEMLTKVITAEVNRVAGEIKVEMMNPHWTSGLYKGMKMPSLEYGDQMLVFDFPQVTAPNKDGGSFTAQMFPVELDGNRMKGYVIFDQQSGMEMELTMDTYSYVANKKEDVPKEIHTVILSNGVEFDVYPYGLAEDGKASMVYCCHVLANDAGYSKDKPYYLNIEFDGNGVQWTSIEEVKQTLESIVADNMYFVDPADDPYVPGAAPVTAAPAADEGTVTDEKIGGSEVSNGWACPSCNSENSGNFCSNCGTKKPETKGPWACPSCNTENSGNFCSNCGTKKP